MTEDEIRERVRVMTALVALLQQAETLEAKAALKQMLGAMSGEEIKSWVLSVDVQRLVAHGAMSGPST